MMKRIVCVMLAVMLAAGLFACQDASKQTDAPKTGAGSPADPSNASGPSASDGGLLLYDEKEIGIDSGLRNPSEGRINSKNQLVVLDGRAGNDVRFVTLDQEGKPAEEVNAVWRDTFKALIWIRRTVSLLWSRNTVKTRR